MNEEERARREELASNLLAKAGCWVTEVNDWLGQSGGLYQYDEQTRYRLQRLQQVLRDVRQHAAAEKVRLGSAKLAAELGFSPPRDAAGRRLQPGDLVTTLQATVGERELGTVEKLVSSGLVLVRLKVPRVQEGQDVHLVDFGPWDLLVQHDLEL